MVAFDSSSMLDSYTIQHVYELKAKQTPIKWKDPKDIITQFSNRVLVGTRDPSISQVIFWCVENIPNRYHYDYVYFYSNPDGEYMAMFSFAKKEDAMAFKLAWA